jgi:hypothetical protein
MINRKHDGIDSALVITICFAIGLAVGYYKGASPIQEFTLSDWCSDVCTIRDGDGFVYYCKNGE